MNTSFYQHYYCFSLTLAGISDPWSQRNVDEELGIRKQQKTNTTTSYMAEERRKINKNKPRKKKVQNTCRNAFIMTVFFVLTVHDFSSTFDIIRLAYPAYRIQDTGTQHYTLQYIMLLHVPMQQGQSYCTIVRYQHNVSGCRFDAVLAPMLQRRYVCRHTHTHIQYYKPVALVA